MTNDKKTPSPFYNNAEDPYDRADDPIEQFKAFKDLVSDPGVSEFENHDRKQKLRQKIAEVHAANPLEKNRQHGSQLGTSTPSPNLPKADDTHFGEVVDSKAKDESQQSIPRIKK